MFGFIGYIIPLKYSSIKFLKISRLLQNQDAISSQLLAHLLQESLERLRSEGKSGIILMIQFIRLFPAKFLTLPIIRFFHFCAMQCQQLKWLLQVIHVMDMILYPAAHCFPLTSKLMTFSISQMLEHTQPHQQVTSTDSTQHKLSYINNMLQSFILKIHWLVLSYSI